MDAQEIVLASAGELSEQELQVNEEVEHEVFIDDVWPVLVPDVGQNRRTKHPVQRDDLGQLRKA
jgi:hypothetical protein